MTNSRVRSIRPGAADLREPSQAPDLFEDSVVDRNGGLWVVRFDLVEDAHAILERHDGPLQTHESTSRLA
jgi:hypothetical protein